MPAHQAKSYPSCCPAENRQEGGILEVVDRRDRKIQEGEAYFSAFDRDQRHLEVESQPSCLEEEVCVEMAHGCRLQVLEGAQSAVVAVVEVDLPPMRGAFAQDPLVGVGESG